LFKQLLDNYLKQASYSGKDISKGDSIKKFDIIITCKNDVALKIVKEHATSFFKLLTGFKGDDISELLDILKEEYLILYGFFDGFKSCLSDKNIVLEDFLGISEDKVIKPISRRVIW